MIKSKIKICGIKDIKTLQCCIENNVKFFGLIFYRKSSRNIKNKDAIRLIKYSEKKNIKSVGVFVDESIDKLNKKLKILKLDYLQLHGNENDEYIKFLKKHNDIKIIKSISINTSQDFLNISKYHNNDLFLFDYKPLKNELPGGNAKKFDWALIKDIKIEKPWFLSGGINIKNINDIKKYAIPYGIDISSGVEVIKGIKNNEKINNLINSYESK